METSRYVRPAVFCLATSLLAGSLGAADGMLSVEKTDQGAAVSIDGRLFCEYLIKSGRQPVIWPVNGPSGQPMTRSYPIGPRAEHEETDHIHHRSIWFTHGLVNGLDFWATRQASLEAGKPQNEIVHRDFTELAIRDNVAVVGTRNDWVSAQGKVVCSDQRTIRMSADDQYRWIDYTTQLIASHGDVTFGDTKEGTFAVRVAGTMKVDEKLGGQIVSSTGRKGADAWGQPAEWVDYYGPVAGETVGIALFSSPENYQHPCRWHVRTYGLFAANPFGVHHFPKSDHVQGAKTIAAGDSLTLRYRVLLHQGTTEEAEIAERYKEFAK